MANFEIIYDDQVLKHLLVQHPMPWTAHQNPYGSYNIRDSVHNLVMQDISPRTSDFIMALVERIYAQL